MEIATQTFPYPYELAAAVEELRYSEPSWKIELVDMERGQDCKGLTLLIYPDKPDSYHPERHVNTQFLYPVPAAAFNRESWEEWLWARIEDTENHERAENFKFVTDTPGEYQRPFKPAHPDGWDPSVVRTVVSETVVNTPNAGRLVKFPCECGHLHSGRMGEHFQIEFAFPCTKENCPCTLGRNT
jgi:hypothetical protein